MQSIFGSGRMIKKTMILFMTIILLTSCASEESKKKQEASISTETIKFDLIYITDEIIRLLNNKNYIMAYEKMKLFHEKSNELGMNAEQLKQQTTNLFVSEINALTNRLFMASNKQKRNEVYYTAMKSRLQIMSVAQKKASETMPGQSGATNGENSNSESSQNELSAENIIIPEEEIVKRYPEITMTKYDLEVQNDAAGLYQFCSLLLDSEKESMKKQLFNIKYYLYKINYLAKLKRYNEVKTKYKALTNDWQQLYTEIIQNHEMEAKKINTVVLNINALMEEKNTTVIDVTTQIGIKTVDDLISKSS